MKRPSLGFDKIQVFGFTVSVSISVLLMLLGQGRIESTILGIGIAVMTNQFAMQKRISDAEGRLLDATPLNRHIFEDPWLLRHISSIVSDYSQVKDSPYKPFVARAKYEIERAFETLHALSEGRMRFERASPFSFGSTGITQAIKTLHATTTTAKPYGEFWRSEPSKKYLRKNKERITAGVQVERVFIMKKAQFKEDFDILNLHRANGVKVYVAWEENLKPELRENFIIMDDQVVTTTVLAVNGRVNHWMTYIAETEVEKWKRAYEVIRRNALSLEEVEISVGGTATDLGEMSKHTESH